MFDYNCINLQQADFAINTLLVTNV